MSQYDAVFVGLTLLDIAGRPVSAIPAGGGVQFIEQIRLNPAGTASGARFTQYGQFLSALWLGKRKVGCFYDIKMSTLITSGYTKSIIKL
ncbi:hypothetical protein Q5A_013130 [Serratia inhibens PRI-2C]|nr:hypothetical protein Q5A_013130 [Serratia inhibens PRI-2C]